MKYFFGYPHWPERFREYISEEEYQTVFNHYSFLINVCDIEDHYDIMINNYSEFESCINNILINNFLAFGFEIMAFKKNERDVVRLLNNLLSSCRLFLDNNLKILFNINNEIYENYKQKTNALYDNNVEYRLLEYLRNILQHSSAPISIEYYIDYAKTEDDKCKEGINIVLNVEYLLSNDMKYNKKVKNDLVYFNQDKIIINNYIRKYIFLLGSLLNEIRTLLQVKYNQSYSYYSDLLINKVQVKLPPEKEIQKIVHINKEEDGVLIKHALSDVLIKNLDLLQKRNSLNKDYSRSIMIS